MTNLKNGLHVSPLGSLGVRHPLRWPGCRQARVAQWKCRNMAGAKLPKKVNVQTHVLFGGYGKHATLLPDKNAEDHDGEK